ncbi:MAG: hypothetical protein V4661_00960 [Pseudomonadota bacterium]
MTCARGRGVRFSGAAAAALGVGDFVFAGLDFASFGFFGAVFAGNFFAGDFFADDCFFAGVLRRDAFTVAVFVRLTPIAAAGFFAGAVESVFGIVEKFRYSVMMQQRRVETRRSGRSDEVISIFLTHPARSFPRQQESRAAKHGCPLSRGRTGYKTRIVRSGRK